MSKVQEAFFLTLVSLNQSLSLLESTEDFKSNYMGVFSNPLF